MLLTAAESYRLQDLGLPPSLPPKARWMSLRPRRLLSLVPCVFLVTGSDSSKAPCIFLGGTYREDTEKMGKNYTRITTHRAVPLPALDTGIDSPVLVLLSG